VLKNHSCSCSNEKYPLLVLLRLLLKNTNSCQNRLLYSGSCTLLVYIILFEICYYLASDIIAPQMLQKLQKWSIHSDNKMSVQYLPACKMLHGPAPVLVLLFTESTNQRAWLQFNQSASASCNVTFRLSSINSTTRTAR